MCSSYFYIIIHKQFRNFQNVCGKKKFTLFNSQLINEVIKDINEDIDLIGFHGQTVFHNPKIQISKQLGDGRLLSSLFRKIVINVITSS